MIVYRIVDQRYQDDLSGTGAGLYGGRWNKVDEFVLYTASNVSLACLELLVNVDLAFKTPVYVLLTVEIPNDVIIRTIDSSILPKNWRSTSQYGITKEIGSQWYTEQIEGGMVVPSAVIPQERNYLFNASHPRSKDIKIINTEPFLLDNRLLK